MIVGPLSRLVTMYVKCTAKLFVGHCKSMVTVGMHWGFIL
jgi:hypothetical protein